MKFSVPSIGVYSFLSAVRSSLRYAIPAFQRGVNPLLSAAKGEAVRPALLAVPGVLQKRGRKTAHAIPWGLNTPRSECSPEDEGGRCRSRSTPFRPKGAVEQPGAKFAVRQSVVFSQPRKPVHNQRQRLSQNAVGKSPQAGANQPSTACEKASSAAAIVWSRGRVWV